MASSGAESILSEQNPFLKLCLGFLSAECQVKLRRRLVFACIGIRV